MWEAHLGWGCSLLSSPASQTVVQGAPPLPPMPYGEEALPLGDHLAPAVKEKIWKGKYVYLFSLLHMEPELESKVEEYSWEQQTVCKPKIDCNWTNWLIGFAIYMGVVLQKDLTKGLVLA